MKVKKVMPLDKKGPPEMKINLMLRTKRIREMRILLVR
jgi:hypothetical protein